jgi:hypothetical protein
MMTTTTSVTQQQALYKKTNKPRPYSGLEKNKPRTLSKKNKPKNNDTLSTQIFGAILRGLK